MKKVSIVLVALFLFVGFAKAQQNEVEMFQSMFKVEKKAMLMDFLMLTDDEAKVFWPIYEEYEMERVKLSSRRIALIKKYAEEYETLTEEQIDELANESFAIIDGTNKLHKKYYKKFKKAVSAKRAGQFVQFERFVKTSVDNELNRNMPLIGERM